VLRGAPGPSAETRERVLAAPPTFPIAPTARPACSPAAAGICSGVLLDVRNPFHAELVEEVHAEADQGGYEVVLSTLTRDRDEARAIETLLDFRCEALILLGPDSPEARARQGWPPRCRAWWSAARSPTPTSTWCARPRTSASTRRSTT
jgi:DNA-binding LacI/PurR family transcriptional regulator